MTLTQLMSGLVIASIAAVSLPANATTVAINYTGLNGYTAVGSFTYNGATAPTVITEANGAAATNVIQSFSITFANPAHTVIESGSAVINGVSSDRFFRLTYNTSTNAITTLDADIGGTYTYFLSNLRTPTGSVVPAGQTGFNFFDRTRANAALDTAPTITTTVSANVAVPEPSSVLVLPVALLGLLAMRRRQA